MIKVVITAANVSSIYPDAKNRLEAAGFCVEEYPEASTYSKERFLAILHGADAVIAGLEKYPKEILQQLPSLKLIARRGVGVDNIDLEVAKSLGINITITEGIVGGAVAELVLAYLLEASRKLSLHQNDMKDGIWSRRLAQGLKGKTLGLVGFGSIAKETALRANAFGMNVICYYRHRDFASELIYQVEYTGFDTLIRNSDYISIHVPLTKDTENMFSRDIFDHMKPSSVLINTARSAIINTKDLITALKESKISGAYLDVFDGEPCHDRELLTCPNAFCTPHIGTFTNETFQAMNNRCVEQVLEFFHNK